VHREVDFELETVEVELDLDLDWRRCIMSVYHSHKVDECQDSMWVEKGETSHVGNIEAWNNDREICSIRRS
jgi:hypothetical protein